MSICLNMIVRDEAHILRRCLGSVKSHVDSWLIVDTGSTDGTPELVQSELQGLPGELHERPWRGLAESRNEALALAQNYCPRRRRRADHLLFLDADEVWRPGPGFVWPELGADAYLVAHELRTSGVFYYRVQLVRAELPWRYTGVAHDVLRAGGRCRTERLETVTVQDLFDGARNRDARQKYEADARVLAEALRQEPDNARYAFYLAQSYRDAGQFGEAAAAYARRVRMGGWPEEVWYCLYQLAVLSERAGAAPAQVLAAYRRACAYRPQRAEPLVAAARYCRRRGDHARAFAFSAEALAVPLPSDILFVERAAYRWRALDEYCVAAYYLGRYQDSLDAAVRLLGAGQLPAAERARVEANRDFAFRRVEAA
jgi:tetratricopeptide (TPR) repeat protein